MGLPQAARCKPASDKEFASLEKHDVYGGAGTDHLSPGRTEGGRRGGYIKSRQMARTEAV